MYALEKHKGIAKAQGMKFVIPMKPSIQPREIDAAYKSFIYDEFAQRYLESIGVEPTKININALREKHKIHPDDLELVRPTRCEFNLIPNLPLSLSSPL